MNILFPFVGDSIGGSHISTLELYLSLLDKDISAVIVLHRGDGPLSQYLRNRNISFFILETSILAGTAPGKISIFIGILTNFFRFGSFIKKNEIDIVHGNDLRINLSWSLPAKIFSKGFVWHQRTLLSTSKSWLLINYLCDYFVAISDVVMQSSPKNISSDKKKIVYNPFNTTSLKDKKAVRNYIFKKYNIPDNCFLLGCVGRIVDYKNIDFLIKNIYDINRKINKNICLIIVGTGKEEYVDELKTYIRNLDIGSYIIFTGFINNPSKIVASLDLLVASSIVDAFGRTIVEAMLQNTLVLATRFGGHVDIINDNVNGVLYNPTIKDDFISKISAIVDNENTKMLTDNAYQFAKINFSSKQHLINILPIYYNLLKS